MHYSHIIEDINIDKIDEYFEITIEFKILRTKKGLELIDLMKDFYVYMNIIFIINNKGLKIAMPEINIMFNNVNKIDESKYIEHFVKERRYNSIFKILNETI